MKEASLAKVFKALSNEQRLKIFRTLCDWDRKGSKDGTVSADEGCLDRCFTRTCCTVALSKSTVSHHFKELQNAGLISVKRTGQSFQCTIHYEVLGELRQFLEQPEKV